MESDSDRRRRAVREREVSRLGTYAVVETTCVVCLEEYVIDVPWKVYLAWRGGAPLHRAWQSGDRADVRLAADRCCAVCWGAFTDGYLAAAERHLVVQAKADRRAIDLRRRQRHSV